MSKIDEIKEGIVRWRLIFGLLAVTTISLAGWLAEQYGSGELSDLSRYSERWWLVVSAGLLLVYLGAMLFGIDRIVLRKIKELGEL